MFLLSHNVMHTKINVIIENVNKNNNIIKTQNGCSNYLLFIILSFKSSFFFGANLISFGAN